MNTLMIMAGGTGGHIFPGLAVAEQAKKQQWRVCWLGNPQGMEYPLVTSKHIEFAPISFSALRGKGIKRKLCLPFNLLRAFNEARAHMRHYRPNVVLGLGGYVSFPGGMAAKCHGAKLIVHEQNSIAGMSNRYLSKVANKTLSGFPNSLPKAQWVGNPVREEMIGLAEPAQRMCNRTGPLKLLIIGGSQGATIFNEIVPEALALIPVSQRPKVIHQTGVKQVDSVIQHYNQLNIEADCRAFIDDVAACYADADIVLCRSGALTIAELSAAGVASILVPYPFAVDDHQTVNAQFLSQQSAGVLLPQTEFTASHLAQLLQQFTRPQLLEMAQKARAQAKVNAAQKVFESCQQLAGGSDHDA